MFSGVFASPRDSGLDHKPSLCWDRPCLHHLEASLIRVENSMRVADKRGFARREEGGQGCVDGRTEQRTRPFKFGLASQRAARVTSQIVTCDLALIPVTLLNLMRCCGVQDFVRFQTCPIYVADDGHAARSFLLRPNNEMV